MEDSKVITIDKVVPPLTGNVFDYLIKGYAMLALLMPFLSSTRVSLFWKKKFLAVWPIGFSSLLQGSPRGRVVTLL